MPDKRPDLPYRLCNLALLMTLIVISLGALTRLLDAGLGCPDWPGCYGQLIPPTSGSGINELEPGKAWMEMIHRYIAGSLGIVILMLMLVIERTAGLSRSVKWLSRSALLLVIFQALLGMLTVTMLLLPQIVTLHLLGGMALLALLFVLRLQLQAARVLAGAEQIRPLAVTVLLLLCCQIALGGWTSSHYAGLACTDFPRCQNQWLPQLKLRQAFDLTERSDFSYEGGVLAAEARRTIHVLHRYLALVLLLSVISLCVRAWPLAQFRLPALVLLGLTLLQLSLGIANVLLLLPLPLALAHNTGAALLLLGVVYINYLAFPALHNSRQPVSRSSAGM